MLDLDKDYGFAVRTQKMTGKLVVEPSLFGEPTTVDAEGATSVYAPEHSEQTTAVIEATVVDVDPWDEPTVVDAWEPIEVVRHRIMEEHQLASTRVIERKRVVER